MSSSPRNRAYDGLRGLAALLVVVAHYYVQIDIAGAWELHYALKHLLTFSGSGVDVFFVLSGYLVGGIILDQRHTPRFLRVFFTRRAARILPAYLLLLLLFPLGAAALNLSDLHHTLVFGPPVPFWAYVGWWQNEWMVWTHQLGPWWTIVTWSVAVEVQFYVLAPFVLRHLPDRAILRGALAVLILAPLLRWLLITVFDQPLAASYATLAHCDGLILGIALNVLLRREAVTRRLANLRPQLSWALAAGAILLALLPFQSWAESQAFRLAFIPSLVALLAAVTIALLHAPGPSRWGRLFMSRPLVGLGALSYFIYLFHLPVLYLAHGWRYRDLPIHLTPGHLATTAAAFGTLLLAGCLSYFLLERPLIRWGHRRAYQLNR